MSSTPPRCRATSSSAAPATARRSLALDGKTYTLDAGDVRHRRRATASNRSPASWAARHSGCDENTTDVLIELALWEPLNIARTGRTLGINTDARYRFERGVDPAFMRAGPRTRDPAWCSTSAAAKPSAHRRSPAACREPDMIIDFPLARGEAPDRPRRARLRDEASHPAGARLLASRAPAITVEGRGAVLAAGRRWQGRPRRGGRAHRRRRPRAVPLPLRPPRRRSTAVLTLDPEAHAQRAKRALAARGLVEAVTWSFIAQAAGRAVRRRRAGARRSPTRSRPTCPTCGRRLLPGLLAAAQRNADRGYRDVALFEVGQVYRGRQAGGPARSRPRRPPRHGQARRARAGTGRARRGAGRCVRRQGRRAGAAGSARRADVRRLQIVRADRPGIIPAARARSSSGRRS